MHITRQPRWVGPDVAVPRFFIFLALSSKPEAVDLPGLHGVRPPPVSPGLQLDVEELSD